LIPLQAAGQEGTVTGTLTLNGVPVAMAHVYASAQPGFFDKSTEDVHVLFSDAPLSDADRRDVFVLMHLGRDGKARILEVVLDKDGKAISGSLFAPEFGGQVSAAGMHKFERERIERAAIAGRMYTEGAHEFMKVTYQYDLRFSAPIPRPPSAAELAERLAGPPARAAADYLAAIRRNDLAAVRAALTPEAAAAFQGAEGAARLEELRADLPADAAVVGLEPQADGSNLARIDGHRGTVVIGYTFRMVLVNGAWRVGK
jgi:hypothetical protein